MDIGKENKPVISIPYVEGLAEKMSETLHSYNINTALQNIKNPKNFCKPTKDKILKKQSSNILYSVPCKGSDSEIVYISQTKWFISGRLKEQDNKKYNIEESPNKQNSLAEHAIQEDHFFNFHRTKILAKEIIIKKDYY